MAHGTVEKAASKPEIEKASILQALAIKEEQEIHSLEEAQEKAMQLVAEAQARTVERGKQGVVELKALEKEILDRETAAGQKEAAEIRTRAQQELEKQVKEWQKRISVAAVRFFQRIISVK